MTPFQASEALHWHVLGGNNKHHIGANCGLCVYDYKDADGVSRKKTILFDAGVLIGDRRHPEDPALSDSDTIIPDLGRFLYKKDNPAHVPDPPLDSIFLTHNHPDHLGALPLLVLMGYALPKIYATPYTVKRLEQEFSNAGLDPSEWPEIYAIAPGKPVLEGPVQVTAFSVSHSTPQSVGFFIETPEGNILHPGDFKLDQSVVWGPAFNEDQFRRIVSKPVDLLLLDSTGADRDIVPTTEADVRETLRELMEEYPNKRFVVAVMGGFEENLASVALVASEYDRTLWVAGSAHEQALSALKETGMSLSDHIGQEVDVRVLTPGKSARDLTERKPCESVVVVTGAQGHDNAALTRAVAGQHKSLHLDPKTDVILFCAPSIPGQEASRERLLMNLRNKGYTVLTRQDAPLYSQAHARLPEMIDFVKMANPKHILPVHGSKELRDSCAEAMRKMDRKTVMSENGGAILVSKKSVLQTDPAMQGKAPMIGFKTLQGTSWSDRHYLMTSAPAKENAPPKKEAANGNKKPRPRIFKAD